MTASPRERHRVFAAAYGRVFGVELSADARVELIDGERRARNGQGASHATRTVCPERRDAVDAAERLP